MTRGCGAFTRDGKNINKSPLSREKVLISGYVNGRLRAYFILTSCALSFYVSDECEDLVIVDISAAFAYKEALDHLALKSKRGPALDWSL